MSGAQPAADFYKNGLNIKNKRRFLTSFIRHDNNFGGRPQTSRVSHLKGNQVLSERGETLDEELIDIWVCDESLRDQVGCIRMTRTVRDLLS